MTLSFAEFKVVGKTPSPFSSSCLSQFLPLYLPKQTCQGALYFGKIQQQPEHSARRSLSFLQDRHLESNSEIVAGYLEDSLA
jgi:hypothetical protein